VFFLFPLFFGAASAYFFFGFLAALYPVALVLLYLPFELAKDVWAWSRKP
jgi:hypothetical protein